MPGNKITIIIREKGREMGRARYERDGENKGAVYSFKVIYDNKEMSKEGAMRRAAEGLYVKLGLEFKKGRANKERKT